MRVVARGAADVATWDAVFAACPWATFFQSRAWAERWREGAGLAPAAHAVRLADGTRAVLPACRTPLARGLLARRVMPAGTLSGWIADGPLGPAHAPALAAELTRLGDLELRLSPFTPALEAAPLPVAGWDATAVVDLSPGFEAVVRDFSKGHRSAARKAFREGVEVARAEGLAAWRAYHEVYEATLGRWGERAQGRHPWALFASLARAGDPRVALWLARHRGRVVAGAVCLSGPRHVAYWHGAAREEAFGLRPVHALLHEALRAACEAGARWFDMGSSGGLEGVAHFKRGFGARELAIPLVRRHSWPARAAARTGRLWRRARTRAGEHRGARPG